MFLLSYVQLSLRRKGLRRDARSFDTAKSNRCRYFLFQAPDLLTTARAVASREIGGNFRLSKGLPHHGGHGRALAPCGSAMARKLRYTPEDGALFEITCRTIHSRFLLRPNLLLNEIVVGVLARAKRRYGVELSAFCFLSNHFHFLIRVEDSQQLARFMGYVCSKLAREVGRLTGWREKIFSRRYQAILISEEESAQVERLRYLLSHGSKENLVPRPQDWPGVHCVDALLTGQPMEGTWFDRTKEYAARSRGEDVAPRRFATREVLELDPLPCWRHVPPDHT
jgi:REP element-mobilizing transposase RayT